jgi:acyl carrier protein
MHSDTERIVIELVACRKSLDPQKVSLDSTFAELGIDSLDGLEIIFSLEDRFKITIPDDVAQTMKSVRQVIDGLNRLNPPLTGETG